jgi:two-component system response regulator EvgA
MKKALIVDDHPVVGAAVRLVLEWEGFKLIYEASSVGEALSILREHAVDLVILDLVMPGGDGLELLDRIRANGWLCLVLVFTSLDPLFFQERCMRAGAMAYVAKTRSLQQIAKSRTRRHVRLHLFRAVACGIAGPPATQRKRDDR